VVWYGPASRIGIPCGTRTIKIGTARNRAVDVRLRFVLRDAACRAGFSVIDE
jgi:hypothetical protein